MHAMDTIKLITINLITTFVILEGGLRVFYAVTDRTPPHSNRSVVAEWRWVTNRLIDGKVNFDPRFTHDPYAGWKNAPNLDVTDAYGSHVGTNRHGMRNSEDFPLSRTDGLPRLMILGDSYSFGYGVSDNETFSYLLGNEHLADWSVMNLAVSATGTDQHYIMYEQIGEKFQPDVVLLGFYVLDFNRNTLSFRDYAKPMFIPGENGELVLTHSPVPAPEQLAEEYVSGARQLGGWKYSYAYAVFANLITTRIDRSRSPESLPRKILAGIMEKFSQRVHANGATPIWVIFPIQDIEDEDESKYDVIELFAEEEANRLGMPVLRLQSIFREYILRNPDESLWRPHEIGGHLSAAGHQLVAKSISEFLRTNNLLALDSAN